MKGQCLPYNKVPKVVICLLFSIDMVTLPSKEPMRGQNVFLMVKYQRYLYVFYFQVVYLESQHLISLK